MKIVLISIKRIIQKIFNPRGIATLKNRPWIYTLHKIVDLTANMDGDIVECGVFKGSTLFSIALLLKQRNINKKIYGLDSFEGLPEMEDIDKGITKETFGNTNYSTVCRGRDKLGLSNIILIKGFFKDTLKKLEGEKFILVHLDCDLYQSYKECLEFLYDKVLPGGYILFDEYSHGAKKAIDEFLADKKEKLDYFKGITRQEDVRYFIRKE